MIPKKRFNEFFNKIPLEPMGTLGVFTGGGTPDKGKPDFWQGKVPWISSSDIEEDNINTINISRRITHEAIENSATKLIPKNSLLFISRVGVGKLAINKVDLCTSQDFTSFTPHNLVPEYLGYFFQKNKNLLKRYSQGTSIKGLTSVEIKKIKVSNPVVSEQLKIVDFLSSIDKKIRLLKEKHFLLTRYKKGVMQKLFKQEVRFKGHDGNEFPEWNTRKFSDFICARVEYPSASDSSLLASLTIENGIEAKSARYVRDFLVNDESEAYKLVFSQDFVLNPMNLRFGAIARNNGNQKVKISKYYDVFFVDQSIHTKYFELYLRSYEMMKAYHQTATGTLEEKKRVHFSEFKLFEKALPCFEEQKKIADFANAMDSKINIINEQIELTQTFKKGLLQQMFV